MRGGFGTRHVTVHGGGMVLGNRYRIDGLAMGGGGGLDQGRT